MFPISESAPRPRSPGRRDRSSEVDRAGLGHVIELLLLLFVVLLFLVGGVRIRVRFGTGEPVVEEEKEKQLERRILLAGIEGDYRTDGGYNTKLLLYTKLVL